MRAIDISGFNLTESASRLRSSAFAVLLLLIVAKDASAAMLNQSYTASRLLRADVIGTCPEQLKPTLEAALTGAKGLEEGIAALGVLSESTAFDENVRHLFALHRVCVLAQAGRYSEMFEVGRSLLSVIPPSEDRLALCVYLAGQLGMTSQQQLPVSWEERADWIERIHQAVLQEYVQFDREVVDAVFKCAESMDQVAHRYHLETTQGLDNVSDQGERLEIVLRATLIKRDVVSRARTILRDAERITSQVATGAKVAEEGRFSREEAQEKMKVIQRSAEGYDVTVSGCEEKRTEVSAELAARKAEPVSK